MCISSITLFSVSTFLIYIQYIDILFGYLIACIFYFIYFWKILKVLFRYSIIMLCRIHYPHKTGSCPHQTSTFGVKNPTNKHHHHHPNKLPFKRNDQPAGVLVFVFFLHFPFPMPPERERESRGNNATARVWWCVNVWPFFGGTFFSISASWWTHPVEVAVGHLLMLLQQGVDSLFKMVFGLMVTFMFELALGRWGVEKNSSFV